MANLLAKIQFPTETGLPRDTFTINPTYDTADSQGLANALMNHLTADADIGAARKIDIYVYSLDTPPPSYPLAEAHHAGTFSSIGVPHEVALCLSYYAGANRPSNRGRLYLPMMFVGGTLDKRPTTAQMTNVVAKADIFGKNLPANTYWTVYSRKHKTGYRVTNVWCDDEWDTVRSRGLRGTTRITGTIP